MWRYAVEPSSGPLTVCQEDLARSTMPSVRSSERASTEGPEVLVHAVQRIHADRSSVVVH